MTSMDQMVALLPSLNLDELNQFAHCLSEHLKNVRRSANWRAVDTINVGQTYTLTNIKPARWNGVVVTVHRKMQTKVEVAYTERGHTRYMVCPAACLKPIVAAEAIIPSGR